MLHTVTVRALAIAMCGWLLAWDATALTLGRARGAVLIGRPLELTIPATLDSAETDPCAGADLFHGEQKVTRAPTVRWESRDGKEGVLHVSSAVAVDEPMVTLYLRVGCGQPTSRRYVLLAELPPEEAVTGAGRAGPASVPVVPPAARAAMAPGATPPGGPAARAPTAAAPAAARKPVEAPERKPVEGPARKPVEGPARKPVEGTARKTVEPPARQAEAPRPVLKLQPLDLSIEVAPTLRMSGEIGTQPTSDPQRRQAAAALWQALQKGPEEAVQEAQRVQAMQRELQTVREVTRQNAAAVAGLRAQVEQAQGERGTASALVLALAAVLAGLLALLGWRWYRGHRVDRVGRWFEAQRPAAAPLATATPTPVPSVPDGMAAGAAVPANTAVPPPPAGAQGRRLAPPVVPWSPSSMQDFHTTRGGSIRMVGVEELLDVHDKADFFLSIGETDQAVAVLESHVHDQVETSVLPWLDLLELYHSLGRRMEFDRLRGEFLERFTAQVPDFEHFDQPTPTLENYGRALSRIVALWPTRRVLDVIEESIFRKPGLPGAEPFSLEAYRELALLYHIATDLSPAEEPRDKAAPATGFRQTSLQPLNQLDAPERPAPQVDLLLVPPQSPNVGVDIDVTASEDEPDSMAPLDFDLDSQPDAPAGPPQDGWVDSRPGS